STSLSTRSAGTCTVILRSRPWVASMETCIAILLEMSENKSRDSAASRHGFLPDMVRKERLELSPLAGPGPKPGASTNSATFAEFPGFAKTGNYTGFRPQARRCCRKAKTPGRGRAFLDWWAV